MCVSIGVSMLLASLSPDLGHKLKEYPRNLLLCHFSYPAVSRQLSSLCLSESFCVCFMSDIQGA